MARCNKRAADGIRERLPVANRLDTVTRKVRWSGRDLVAWVFPHTVGAVTHGDLRESRGIFGVVDDHGAVGVVSDRCQRSIVGDRDVVGSPGDPDLVSHLDRAGVDDVRLARGMVDQPQAVSVGAKAR